MQLFRRFLPLLAAALLAGCAVLTPAPQPRAARPGRGRRAAPIMKGASDMKTYCNPTLELLTADLQDVIRTSPITPDGGLGDLFRDDPGNLFG